MLCLAHCMSLPLPMSMKTGVCGSASCHGGSGSRQALLTCETYSRTMTSDLENQARKCWSVTSSRGFGSGWPQPSFSKWRIRRRSTRNVLIGMTPPAACGNSCVYMCCNSIQAAVQHRASGTIPDLLHPRRTKRLLSRNVHASASARYTWHCAHLQAMPEWQQPGWHAPRA